MAEKTEKLLVPVEEYLKSGVHFGSKTKTGYVSNFVYKVRPDGLPIMDLNKINERIKIVGKFLARYDPQDILVVCRRKSGVQHAKKFAEAIGAHYHVGRYLPGTLTNVNYEKYVEPKVVFICDPWQDTNAVLDAYKIGVVLVSLVNTNNTLNYVDVAIPCNNKSGKSLSLVYSLLAKIYLEERSK
ncbi:30S ribosomal protein S2 [Nanoarchaeota archaeon]|nr:MAG: 30S ribosomal protein S2 [Nanoarchaeota archaeon]